MHSVAILALFSSILLFVGFPIKDEKPSFEKDVYPIVKTYCVKCHKPGGSKKAQGLLMDTAESALTNLLNAKPSDETFETFVVSGKADKSVLYLKLTDPPYGKKMPLGSDKPSKEEIKIIKDWIDSGLSK